jgi:hypothetical protein
LAIAGLVHGQGTVQEALKLLETELEVALYAASVH